MVRRGGFEPPCLAAHAPQTCVSAIPPPPHFYFNYFARPAYTYLLQLMAGSRHRVLKVWFRRDMPVPPPAHLNSILRSFGSENCSLFACISNTASGSNFAKQNLVAQPGFEPGNRVPETRVLPLHYRAIFIFFPTAQ